MEGGFGKVVLILTLLLCALTMDVNEARSLKEVDQPQNFGSFGGTFPIPGLGGSFPSPAGSSGSLPGPGLPNPNLPCPGGSSGSFPCPGGSSGSLPGPGLPNPNLPCPGGSSGSLPSPGGSSGSLPAPVLPIPSGSSGSSPSSTNFAFHMPSICSFPGVRCTPFQTTGPFVLIPNGGSSKTP